MEWLRYTIDYGIIGLLVFMSVTAVAVALERKFLYKRINIAAFKDKKALELELTRKLHIIATIGSNAPYIGLLGTVLGFIQTFGHMEEAGLNAHVGQLSSGIWQALVCAAAGLAVAIPAHAAYNYLVSRINSIVLDMERAATEIVQIVLEGSKPQPAP